MEKFWQKNSLVGKLNSRFAFAPATSFTTEGGREGVIGRGIQFVKLLKEEEQISLLCRTVKLVFQNLR